MENTNLAIGIAGYSGRFGSRLQAAAEERGWTTCWRCNRAGIEASAVPAVIFDCSDKEAVPQTIEAALIFGSPLVLATTGADWKGHPMVIAAARQIPVVLAANLSRGYQLLMGVARLIGDARQAATRVTVIDRHPVTNKTSPSDTAYRLASALDTERIVAMRAGLPVAEYQFVLAWEGETLEISHRVTSMVAPVQAALAALEKASRLRCPGLFDLESPEMGA